jgi:hypothetical protein
MNAHKKEHESGHHKARAIRQKRRVYITLAGWAQMLNFAFHFCLLWLYVCCLSLLLRLSALIVVAAAVAVLF